MKRAFVLLYTIVMMSVGCAYSEGRFKSVGEEEFFKFIANPEVQLVDVRRADEYNEGHIAGAENIDVTDQEFELKASRLDKSRPVAIYCRSGRRSKIAAERLSRLGYDVTELDGGVLSWHGELHKR